MIVIEMERTGTLGLDITVRVMDTEQAQPLGERTFPPGSKMSPINLMADLAGRTQCVRIELGREGNKE